MPVEVFGMQRRGLGAYGLFPSEKFTIFEKLYCFLTFIPVFLIFLFDVIGLYFCHGNSLCMIENITSFMQMLTGVQEYVSFAITAGTMRRLLDELQKLNGKYFTLEKQQEFEDKMSFFYKCFMSVCVMALSLFFLMALMERPHCVKKQKAYGKERKDVHYVGNRSLYEPCAMPNAALVPVDISKTKEYAGIYVFETFTMMYTVFGLCIIATVGMTFMMWIVEHLKQLKDQIKDVCTGEIDTHLGKLDACITYHIDIVTFGHLYRSLFKIYLFPQLYYLPLILGACGFNIIVAMFHSDSAKLMQYLSIIIGYINEIFCFSYLGELLITESLSIGDMVYEIPWYEESTKFGSKIIMIIMRSQAPLCSYGGPTQIVCIDSFCNSVVNAYSFVSLALKVLGE